MASDMVVVFAAMHSTWLAKASYHDSSQALEKMPITKVSQYLALRNISLKLEY